MLLILGMSSAVELQAYDDAVECALKSCVLVRIMNTGIIFEDKKSGERCWTHNLEDLLDLAELGPHLDREAATDLAFRANWIDAKEWTEASRYQQISQVNAELLVAAISEPTHGVIQWIKSAACR